MTDNLAAGTSHGQTEGRKEELMDEDWEDAIATQSVLFFAS
jgi:hypothetical protein